jgi:hypothetical protein
VAQVGAAGLVPTDSLAVGARQASLQGGRFRPLELVIVETGETFIGQIS